jgi:Xaa-Pro dipeptidase
VRYLIGAPMLWNAGTRAFAPICVVVRASEDIHLMSTWDEGIPEEIPRSNFLGITWNPMNFLSWLQNIGAAAAAGRVGVDSVSPFFEQMLPVAFPGADIVDGEEAIHAARRIKTVEEVAAIGTSLAVAEGALAATVAQLRPGIHERELTGVFMEAMASLGVTTPSRQDVVTITSRPQDARSPKGQERVREGDLVAFTAGVIDGGYAGEVARTWPAGVDGEVAAYRDLYGRWDELWGRLFEACRPGASGADLFEAYEKADVALPPVPIARGIGLGLDVPFVVGDLPATAKQRLEPGAVLAVTGVVGSALGEVVGQEVVLIADDGPKLLTSSPFWNH